MTEPTVQLYSQVCLNRNFPNYQLKQGDIARFIDTVPGPDGIEEGYVLEIFNALGESLNTVVVPKSAVSPLNSSHILSVRSLAST
ncbi:MAG: DUF4926 domain-containing protein [Phormidium sp.]